MVYLSDAFIVGFFKLNFNFVLSKKEKKRKKLFVIGLFQDVLEIKVTWGIN